MSAFLETAKAEFNRMRARMFAADGYEGVKVAGLAVVARDTGAMVFAQRAIDGEDAPDVAETWEFPGGHLEDGEDPFTAAVREFTEEVGTPLPDHEVVHGWRAGEEGQYQGFVVAVEEQFAIDPANADPLEVQDVAWATPEEASTLNLRPEVAELDLEALVMKAIATSGENEGVEMANEDDLTDEMDITEPEFDSLAFIEEPVPVHGVVAPEEVESGDSRAFAAGAITSRPLRIPFRWQESDIGGHDGAVVVGSVDRMMRKDGLIHWEGLLMPTSKADDLTDVIEFFGRFGVSLDGDRGSLDNKRSDSTGVTWFDAARTAGLTAVAIPAFAEAYVALGPHPDMPAEMDDEDDVMVAGACSPALLSFKRGPGWVTNPRETSRLHRYWTKKGQPGYAKVKWGTPGDFRRARALIGEKIAKNSPEKMRYINQIIAQWHFDALGYWPGELGKPGNAPDTKENRRRAATHAALGDGWEPVLAASGQVEGAMFSIEVLAEDDPVRQEGPERAYCAAGCGAPAEYRVSSDNPDWFGLFCATCAPGREDKPLFVLDTLSASGASAAPPASYFDRHPDTGALVITEPDENGIRRTYGYAGEWGVCHIGYDGRCVEFPDDPTGEFSEFHLGRTKTEDGYLNTGLITYKVEHRNAKAILSESAEQAHYDNIAHAWASVRLGTDERGVWFSGVVLPHVSEEDVVLIEASGQVSGEWKYGALRGLQSVNIPGFAVLRSSAAYDDDGNVIALVASGYKTSECPPTPAERMAALRQADAEARFETARALWATRGGQ